MWERLCDALGRPGWRSDPDYLDNQARGRHAAALNAAIAAQLAEQPSAHWTARLEAADVLCAEVQDYAQFRAHPQMQHLGAIGTLEQAPYQPLPMPYLPGSARGTPIAPAPAAGQHTRALLAELGYGSEEIATLERDGIAVQA
jgi:crotonobetainyl-CoA:carnitine CoA-transferase CaiB-like acyl-CoA transferase